MIHICSIFLFFLFEVLSIALSSASAFAAEGLERGRFRFSPELSLSERYTDNVYLTNTAALSDYVTVAAPKVSLDYAFATKNYLTIRYDGEFRHYKNSDNFKKEIHHPGISWTWETPKGSSVKLSAREDFDSVQPYSLQSQHKDYKKKELSGDILFKIGASSDVGIRYGHTTRRFNDPLYVIDNFNEDTFTIQTSYTAFPVTSPLLAYTYSHQYNKQITDPFRDIIVQTFLIGIQQRPSSKLTGFFKAGYFQAGPKSGSKSSGFAMDADLVYQLTEFIKVKLKGYRNLTVSTTVARETGNYFISTGGNISIDYSKWYPLTARGQVSYTYNKFNQQDIIPAPQRKDHYWSAGLSGSYVVRSWFSLTMGYYYTENGSNIELEKYHENRGEVGLSFSL